MAEESTVGVMKLHIGILEASIQLLRLQNEELRNSNTNKTWLIYALVIACPLLLGCMYMYPSTGQVEQITTSMSKFVALTAQSDLSWKIDTPNYWHFPLFSATVTVANLTAFQIAFSAKVMDTPAVSSFRASIIVQVLNPSEHDHHVVRADTWFQATGKEDLYKTGSTQLIDLKGQNKKFYENALKLRIINAEFGLNDRLPLHFSMCHFTHYKENDEALWNTFPFYIDKFKFMIYVYANGIGVRNGKALTMKLYRMKGENDDSLPDKLLVKTVTIKVMKDGGGHALKEFVITEPVRGRVHEGIEVDFQPNHRFPQYGVRSEHGVTITIPHDELEQYIDHDCFIFSIP